MIKCGTVGVLRYDMPNVLIYSNYSERGHTSKQLVVKMWHAEKQFK
jgi:hypothetical protein